MRYASSVRFRAILFTLSVAVWGCGVGESSGGQGSPAGQVSAEQGEVKLRFENRLAHETSPHLLLYAHNPIDWSLWESEALAPLLNREPQSATNWAFAASEFIHNPDYHLPRPVNPGQNAIRIAEASIFPVSAQKRTKKKKMPEIVTAKVFFSVDRLPAGKTCQVMVVLQISHPWHINANPAGDEFAPPTEWTLQSKHRVRLSKVYYPKGKKLTVPGFEKPLFVYTKQAIFRGTLEIPAAAAGRGEKLQLKIRYQACDDRRCLRPALLVMNVPIPVAAEGEVVKAINQKLFRLKKKSAR